MSGWIKIHRKFLDWEWFNKSEAVHLFIYLLLKANHKDASWQGMKVKRGEFISSLGKISSDTGISLQTLRTLLKKLESTNEIEVKSTNKFTTVTICKYDSYQDETEDTNKQLTNNQQTTNKQLTTNKNDKNEKNERSNFKVPTLEEVLAYFEEHKYKKTEAEKAYHFYNNRNWSDSNNRPVKNWKLKMQEVWFKEENKIKVQAPIIPTFYY